MKISSALGNLLNMLIEDHLFNIYVTSLYNNFTLANILDSLLKHNLEKESMCLVLCKKGINSGKYMFISKLIYNGNKEQYCSYSIYVVKKGDIYTIASN